jgi:hypothetical protein
MIHTHSHIDRTIFLRNISTLATSLYIVICRLLDDELSPTPARIRNLWKGTEADLAVAAEKLVKEGILVPMDFSQEDKRWWVFPSTKWFPQRPAEGFLNSGKKGTPF